MRTPAEIAFDVYSSELKGQNAVYKLIEIAQKEAWNEAIDAAAENGKSGLDKGGINKQSILKLKK